MKNDMQTYNEHGKHYQMSKEIHLMWIVGYSYVSIGEKFDITPNRARHIVLKIEFEQTGDYIYNLFGFL